MKQRGRFHGIKKRHFIIGRLSCSIKKMPASFRREAFALFAGDIFFLVLALWATLLIRYAAFPKPAIFYQHLVPFSLLFLLSAMVFLIAGLYEKHTLLVTSRLPETVFYAQIANVIVGALFFFLIPYFGIQPKTNLFIYLILSTCLVSAWRMYLFPRLSVSAPEPALLVGPESVSAEILREINGNTRYDIRFTTTLGIEKRTSEEIRAALLHAIAVEKISAIVLPFPLLHERGVRTDADTLILSGVKFIDLEGLYEHLFDRTALPLLDETWFLEAHTNAPARIYDIAKRLTDIFFSFLALVILSPVLLLVWLALMLQGGNPLIFQKRVGKNNRRISIYKFRSMLFDDGEDPDKKRTNRITRLGSFLRKTQIDEFPQFFNVLRGDLSLIGPRPEIPHFAEEYERRIPYYGARHLIQPGISGLAQIKHASPPKFSLDVGATEEKLSYDLYYLKHRSFLLDMEITFRTIHILLSWASR
ncbi:MAG: exopolysaccharide biosynthesis polyprenyl glycosylphosphotransferase [Patescibacteria group bacterium]|nr:exopolysaccharide biosynthesis polyprenyl glycosylphosphotransferase [Patescibacteria group bacterium]